MSDNSAFWKKRALRLAILARVGKGLVLETNGGLGLMGRSCYQGYEGVVIEANRDRARELARNRVTWPVYAGHSEHLLAPGLTRRWKFTFVDVDPYGQPWPILEALLVKEQQFTDTWGLVVTDGLPQRLQRGGFRSTPWIQPWVERLGSEQVYKHYPGIVQERIEQLLGNAGWVGEDLTFYTNRRSTMLYYGLVIRRGGVMEPGN